jgi:hypothetical protein
MRLVATRGLMSFFEDELPMRQAKQEPLVHVLRKQEGPFLRAGRAEKNC